MSTPFDLLIQLLGTYCQEKISKDGESFRCLFTKLKQGNHREKIGSVTMCPCVIAKYAFVLHPLPGYGLKTTSDLHKIPEVSSGMIMRGMMVGHQGIQDWYLDTRKRQETLWKSWDFLAPAHVHTCTCARARAQIHTHTKTNL